MEHIDLTRLELATERLILKVIDEEFADRVLDYYQRNKQFLQEWEPVRDSEFYTLAFQARVLKQNLAVMQSGQGFRVWLFKKSEGLTNTIGALSLNNIVRGAFQSCHVGYNLDAAEINQGYMTEALAAVIKFAFGDMRLHRLEANIMPKNVRSLRVVQKLGFYNEGLAKKYLRINGIWEDHIHMVLLNDAME